MRLAGLEFIRYGRFTGTRLDLPRHVADLHVVHGPNEAGKSTARAAISDLLFGFPHQTRWDFLHEQTSLVLGGAVESEGRRIAFRRRKGRKDTLLSVEGAPLGEDVLRPFLGDVGRERFETLYSLDSEALRRGGEAVLEAKDDLGRLIFEAGTGLAGVTERLRALEAAADEIWAPRARTRRLNERLEAFEEAGKRLRAGQGDIGEWEEADGRRRNAEAAREAALTERKRAQARLERLRRAQRVRPLLRQLAALEARLREQAARHLPADLGARLDALEKQLGEAEQAMRLAAETLERETARRAALRLDDAILRHGAAVETAVRRAHVVAGAEEDLERRRAELAGHDARLARLLADLGRGDLAPERARDVLAPRPAVAGLREALRRRAELARARAILEQGFADLARERDELAGLLGPEPDSNPDFVLAAALERAQETERSAAGLDEARIGLDRLRAAAAQLARRLDPPLPDEPGSVPWETALLPLPPETEIERFAERWIRLDERIARAAAASSEAREALALREAEHACLERSGEAVSAEALGRARARRDALWLRIRAGEEAVAGFEAAMHESDALADRRFLAAEASARLAQAEAAVEAARARFGAAEDKDRALRAARAELDAEWQALWRASGLRPGTPAAMAAWLEAHRALTATLAETQTQAQRIGRIERDVGEAAGALAEALGTGPMPLRALIAEAGQRLRRAEAARAARAERRNRLTDLDRRLAALETERMRLAAQEAEHTEIWARSLAAARLGPELAPTAAQSALELGEELRGAVELAEVCRDRIAEMVRDRGALKADVESLAAGLDEPQDDPFATAARLGARLEQARRAAEHAADRDRRILECARAQEEAEARAHAARDALDRLLAEHGAADVGALRAAIAEAEERRRLEERRRDLASQLLAAGDGRDRAALESEAADSDEDAAPGLVAEAEAALRDTEAALSRAFEGAAEAKAALARFTGGPEAARAAQDRADALAAVACEAERWLELRAAAEVLRLAMERYRSRHQSPLLARAGAVLATVTAGSFTGLDAGWDAGDRPALRALRPDGRPVAPDGLSEGTRDQLFLALRLAAVEQALDDGHALPFVADDLFASFDEIRAHAALRSLASLAHRTQVLVFTHHEHVARLGLACGAALHRPDAGESVLEAAT